MEVKIVREAENMMCKGKLRKMGLEKKMSWRRKSLEAAYCQLQLPDGRMKKRWRQTLVSGAQSLSTRSKNTNWNKGNSNIGLRTFLFTMRVAKHWRRLFREVVESPSVQLLRT